MCFQSKSYLKSASVKREVPHVGQIHRSRFLKRPHSLGNQKEKTHLVYREEASIEAEEAHLVLSETFAFLTLNLAQMQEEIYDLILITCAHRGFGISEN